MLPGPHGDWSMCSVLQMMPRMRWAHRPCAARASTPRRDMTRRAGGRIAGAPIGAVYGVGAPRALMVVAIIDGNRL